MPIIADESVDFGIIRVLRQKGHYVISITEDYSGIEDEEVLNIGFKHKGLLITEDKDFGELTFRLKLNHRGVLLIRLGDLPRKERIELASETIHTHISILPDKFSVLNKNGLRIKSGFNQ